MRAPRVWEYRHITSVINEVGGDKKAAAKMLGISLPSLYRKLEQYNKSQDGSESPEYANNK